MALWGSGVRIPSAPPNPYERISSSLTQPSHSHTRAKAVPMSQRPRFASEHYSPRRELLTNNSHWGAWHFRWGFPMSLSERIQFGVDECRGALARAGRWLPPLVLAIDGRLKNSIIPH